MINHTLTKLTQQLIRQPSISPQDCGCQNIIANYLQKLNFTIEIMHFNNTHNLWAYRSGNKQKNQHTLLFLGHTDIVTPGDLQHWKHPPFSGEIHDNILYGRGACDMKGALAAMLIATKKFITQYPDHQGRLAFIITSDEESNGSDGTIKVVDILIERQERIDYCIVGEPSSHNKLGDVIKNGRRGSLMGKFTIHGIQGHVAYPQYSKNPIHLSIPILLDLINTKWDQKTSTLFPPTTIQITDIYTNNKHKNTNIIPNQIIFNCNFRFNDQSSINSINNQTNQIFKCHQLPYNVNWNLSANPYFSTPGTLTNVIIDVIKKYQQIIPRLETTGGTSDGRFIHKMGAEIVELGALNHTIHQVNECINLIDLELLSEIYQKIIEKILLTT